MDRSGTVLLTGASGFLAKHVALRLLNAGYRVRGTVRSMDRGREVRAAVLPKLRDPSAEGRLSFVEADLEADEGWDRAMRGVTALVHTASPFVAAQPADPAVLLRPAVEGTRRVLAAALRAGVWRVVLTSSLAAVIHRPPPPAGAEFTEEDWSDPDYPTATAYARSKTIAERAAWEMAAASDGALALTTILPGFAIGPPLDDRYGTSVALVRRFLRGRDRLIPRYGLPLVDARDAAEMHLRALDRPETAGQRYAAVAGSLWLQEIAAALKAAHPDCRIASRLAPDLAVRLLGLFDREVRAIVPALGRIDHVSNAKARHEMEMGFTAPRESLRSTAAYLMARGLD